MKVRSVIDEGVRLFNAEEFYECHEVIERLWLISKTSPDRFFYQGLIILAGCFHHVQKRRFAPAKKALQKARMKLDGYPDYHLGVRLGVLRRELEAWDQHLELLVATENAEVPTYPIVIFEPESS